MSASGRIAFWSISVSLLAVAVFGVLALWGFRSVQSLLAGPAPLLYDKPTELANISVSSKPFALAWSADGAYLAAGTCYDTQCEVLVVDVAKASVTATLKVTGDVQTLAFSPDGKWLAVGTRPSLDAGAAPANLVVFDCPAFTSKFTANASKPEDGFVDLAWALDGKLLCAIDGPVTSGVKKVRRWDVPAFAEQPAIGTSQTGVFTALAVSPDGRTLAVADDRIRLIDLASGAERSSFKVDHTMDRIGFTSDGKAVGIYSTTNLSWWEVTTGQPAQSSPARVVIQPAGVSDQRSHYCLSSDGGKQAEGGAEYPKFIGQGMGEPANKYGAFVHVTDTATGKTWLWRVGDAGGTTDSPVVAFSPDGTKLAGTVKQPSGESLVIWAAPK